MNLRRPLAEFLGTLTLVAVVVGSGTMATQMSADRGVELLINAIATVFALGILIFIFAPISGAHFNPVVSLSELIQMRLSPTDFMAYLVAQFARSFSNTFSGIDIKSVPIFILAQIIGAGVGTLMGKIWNSFVKSVTISEAGLRFYLENYSLKPINFTA